MPFCKPITDRITPLDEFAMAAMNGIITGRTHESEGLTIDDIAADAYLIAEAMMIERAKHIATKENPAHD